jgi:glycosyltransferase involved in cell wall biosynthesis
MTTPVTILMPAYNAEKYIGESIGSVLQQTFSDFELLVIDDGSTDGTADLVHSFSDTRIRYVYQTHSGVAAALNAGLVLAKGKYIARFDADDICYPQRLEKQFRFLEDHPDHTVVGSDADYLLENGDHLFRFSCIGHTNEEIMDKLYFYCPFIHSAVMFKKDAVMQAGGYSVRAHNFEDYLLWVRLSAKGKFANLAEPLIRVRFNPASVTIDEKWRSRRFRTLKRDVIRRGDITEAEGGELLQLIRSQDLKKIKMGAYHALCAKKFLNDNYQPGKARTHIVSAIGSIPLRWDNYALLLLSYMPQRFIQWLHRKSPNKL